MKATPLKACIILDSEQVPGITVFEILDTKVIANQVKTVSQRSEKIVKPIWATLPLVPKKLTAEDAHKWCLTHCFLP